MEGENAFVLNPTTEWVSSHLSSRKWRVADPLRLCNWASRARSEELRSLQDARKFLVADQRHLWAEKKRDWAHLRKQVLCSQAFGKSRKCEFKFLVLSDSVASRVWVKSDSYQSSPGHFCSQITNHWKESWDTRPPCVFWFGCLINTKWPTSSFLTWKS